MLMNFHNHLQLADLDKVNKILSKQQVLELRQTVGKIVVEENLIRYISQIVNATRKNPSLFLGASPRASIAILNASKACACLQNRDFVTPEDIRYVCFPVLRHRIVLTPEKEMEGIQADAVIQQIIDKIEVPR
jgi:MoxR-like ATPase